MRVVYIIGIILTAALYGSVLAGCGEGPRASHKPAEIVIDSLVPVVSHSFRIDYYPSYKVITVFAPGQDRPTRYVMCNKDVLLPDDLKEATRIDMPVSRVACLSTTHIGALELLDARHCIAVVANTDLICDSATRMMIGSGAIRSAGHDYQPDYETIAALKPQLLFSDGESGSSVQVTDKLKALGIKVVSSRDYFEQEPLARAEWIKFFAAFVGKEKMADSIFAKVKANYDLRRQSTAEGGAHPAVFCNVPYNGIWYMPCGKNYVARLITDAGGRFLWQEDKPINGLNLTLTFEQVYARAMNADVWINPGVVTSLKQLGAQDAKFKLFKAYKTGQVYNCTNRLSPGGGMDMWETGTFRPDIVLRDLSLIFQPGRAEANLYYYKQLQ